MASRLGLALFAASMVALSAAGAAALLSSDREAELVTLLQHDCGSCHGLTMKGGLGPALRPADLDGKSDEALLEAILDGRPDTPMPPWRGLLTEEEARWMIARLKEGLPQ